MSKRNNCKTQSKPIRQFFGSFKTLSFLYFILWHFWSFSGMKNNAMYLWIILSCAEGGGSRVEFQGCGEVTLVKVFSSVVLQAKERDIVEGTFWTPTEKTPVKTDKAGLRHLLRGAFHLHYDANTHLPAVLDPSSCEPDSSSWREGGWRSLSTTSPLSLPVTMPRSLVWPNTTVTTFLYLIIRYIFLSS